MSQHPIKVCTQQHFDFVVGLNVPFSYSDQFLTFTCVELCRGASTLKLVETRREREHLFSKCLYFCLYAFYFAALDGTLPSMRIFVLVLLG